MVPRIDSAFSKQWIAIGLILAVAVYTQTSLRVLVHLPLELAYRIAATPPMWMPLVVLLLAMTAALLLDTARLRARTDRTAWAIFGLAGALGIVWFFRAGDLDWHATGDWKKEWTYYTAWHDGLRQGQLPWYLNETFQGTDRFFANPETVVAPHVLLLAWISVPVFLVLQYILLFAIGFVSFRQLSAELRFGPIASMAFMAIFLLNGNVIGHLSAGHHQWAGYFVIPCMFLFLHRAAAGNAGARTQAGLALALGLMVAVGGWHVFVWCVIFIGVFVAIDRARWRFGATVAVLVAGLSAVRILPAAMIYGGAHPEFVGSYQRLSVLVGALVGEPRNVTDYLDWWEYNAFVGWAGFVLVTAGLTAPLSLVWRHSVASLWTPSVALLVLSTFNIYEWTLFQLPGFVSERVASRLLIVGLLGFALIGCVQLNLWLKRQALSNARLAALTAAGLLLMTQLVVHTNGRRPASDRQIGPPSINVVSERRPDTAYAASLGGGALVTLISLGMAIRMWRRLPDAHGLVQRIG